MIPNLPQIDVSDLEVMQGLMKRQIEENLGARLTPALGTGLINVVSNEFAMHLEKKAKQAIAEVPTKPEFEDKFDAATKSDK